ncbi:uncharacterized protein METZ01_LOCUS437819 [marine metagenome]|uniref:Uncharacterized protein n=1 Tax=marine metagenome TaxID=408172 RepID=A0A382YQ18_9ZZZZ
MIQFNTNGLLILLNIPPGVKNIIRSGNYGFYGKMK